MHNTVIEVRRENVVTQVNRFCKSHGGTGSVVYDESQGVIVVNYYCTLNEKEVVMHIPITLSEASKVNVYTTLVRRIASNIYESIREEW